MLPDNFDFAMIPEGKDKLTLKEVGMLSSTIEDIDYAIVSWIKEDLALSATTNEGFNRVPVLWQAPERAFQVKHDKELRDDAGALKLPLISIDRTSITKDPSKKGSFQAHLYSDKKDGRLEISLLQEVPELILGLLDKDIPKEQTRKLLFKQYQYLFQFTSMLNIRFQSRLSTNNK